MSERLDRGAAFLCDGKGVIREFIRDELGFSEQFPPGCLLVEVADAGVTEKVENFLTAITSKQAAFDWEITVTLEGELVPLHFAGAVSGEAILVFAARTRNGLARVNDELMRINNEQMNALRSAQKDLAMAMNQSGERDDFLYEELSQLNNELTNLQREMARKNRELEELNRQKNHWLGIASHDLRTPLGVIQTYSEFLLDEAADALDEEQLEFVTTIHETSQFMRQLIDDLLDVARIESGELVLDLEPADLVDTCRQNIKLNRKLAERKGLSIEFACSEACIMLDLDVGKFTQVLNNLVDNAIKFSSSGASIRVFVEAGRDQHTVSVRDEGNGMSEEVQSNLFKLFSRGLPGTQGEKSTGLGLAIAQRIVQGHGGQISVNSQPGKGSTFKITLPAGTDQ